MYKKAYYLIEMICTLLFVISLFVDIFMVCAMLNFICIFIYYYLILKKHITWKVYSLLTLGIFLCFTLFYSVQGYFLNNMYLYELNRILRLIFIQAFAVLTSYYFVSQRKKWSK